MKSRYPILLALLTIVASGGSAGADADGRDEILALIDDVFAAVTSGNPDDWRALQLAEGSALSFRPHPSGLAGELEMRMANNEDFIADLEPDGHEYVERWTEEPTVLIRGPIAVVWGKYDFRTDGEFSHCGVNSIDVVRVEGRWKVANFMWTVERDNCPTAP